MLAQSKADLIKVYDVLLRISPHLRRYLRDYPENGTPPIPVPPSDKDVLTLIDAGFLTSDGVIHQLTPLGFRAQVEIWAAERYVAALIYL